MAIGIKRLESFERLPIRLRAGMDFAQKVKTFSTISPFSLKHRLDCSK
jgi:hypothetical protein